MDHSTEASLALDDDIRHTHFAAKGRKENDEFNGINIVGNDNERGFLGLNQSNNMVETIFDKEGFLGFLLHVRRPTIKMSGKHIQQYCPQQWQLQSQ